MQAVHQLCIEARDRKPGDGVHDERGNIVEPDPGALDGFERHLLQQIECMALEDGGSRFPPMTLVIPIWRLAGVAGLDPGIAIETFEPRQMRENGLRTLGNVVLNRSPASRLGFLELARPRLRPAFSQVLHKK